MSTAMLAARLSHPSRRQAGDSAARIDCKLICGSEPTTTAEENRYLVDAINSFHPGRATYAEFPGMGHGLDLSPSPRAWLEAIQKHQHGEFDEEFLDRVDSWLIGLLKQSDK